MRHLCAAADGGNKDRPSGPSVTFRAAALDFPASLLLPEGLEQERRAFHGVGLSNPLMPGTCSSELPLCECSVCAVCRADLF